MKKIVTMLLTVCLLLSAAAAFASCGHEHSFKSDWSKDATHHWHACDGKDCTEVSEKAEHTWGDPVVNEAKEKVYTCSVCSQTKTEAIKTTVTADEWTAAFDLGTNWKITFTATHPVYHQTMTIMQMRDGNKFHCKETMKDTESGAEESYEDYDEIVGEQWYGYRYDREQDKFEKVTITDPVDERLASMMADYLPEFIKDKDTYTYDEAKKAYVADEILADEDYADIKSVALYFEDGKLVALEYVIVMEETEVPYSATFTYGDASVTLPTNLIEG